VNLWLQTISRMRYTFECNRLCAKLGRPLLAESGRVIIPGPGRLTGSAGHRSHVYFLFANNTRLQILVGSSPLPLIRADHGRVLPHKTK
jgi:hypothetical protein